MTRASDEAKVRALKTERDELKARKALSIVSKSVVELVERMRVKSALEACKADLRTKAISDKSKEFASSAVTEALRKALDQEFIALGIGHIRTKLGDRNDKGKMKYRLLLDLPANTNKLEDVLSEGEQRAIAIGAFLAELRIADHLGGIIFDDPVSSLDHWRRRDVAKRLAAEAKQRQVIVLTHDTSFLGELRDAIEQLGIAHELHHLEWRDSRPGYVNPGLPWGHKSYKERIDSLEKAQKALAKSWPPYPGQAENDKMTHQYDFFRATIERVVQDVVFNGVIQRYRDWIQIKHLEAVVGFDDPASRQSGQASRC